MQYIVLFAFLLSHFIDFYTTLFSSFSTRDFGKGDKNIIKFEGDHNSPRPQFYFDSVNIFFHNVLHPPEDEVGDALFDTTYDYFDKDNWSTIHEVNYADDFLTASIDPTASSTEDAIKQVRSKRPMSRTEVPSDTSSNDKQSEKEEEGSGTKPIPSSSKMIDFEFSSGHRPCVPHVPSSIDDDEYVEYPLDNSSDFPSNVEEEERMFMEAVIESLKALEMRHPHVEEPPSKTDTDPHELSRKESPNKSSTIDHCVSSRTESSTTSAATSGCNWASQLPSPNTSVSSMGPSPGTTPSFVDTDTSTSMKSSSGADEADCTKATVTVVRNPTNNIVRRWDLNFFRNSR